MLALCHCHLDHLLLQNRYFFQRDFDTHVTTCYHDTVCHVNDLFQILNTLHVLNLGNDLDLAASVLYDLAYFLNIFLGSDKGSCDKIKSLLNTKDDIFLIFLCDAWKSDAYVRNINTLLRTKLTTINYCTFNLCTFNLINLKLDKTIIDKNNITCSNIFWKTCISYHINLIICWHLSCC